MEQNLHGGHIQHFYELSNMYSLNALGNVTHLLNLKINWIIVLKMFLHLHVDIQVQL